MKPAMSIRIGGAARLRRRMVERVLTHCETDRKAAEPLLILLRRFATESAREEARMFCEELVADEALRAARARSDRGVSPRSRRVGKAKRAHRS